MMKLTKISEQDIEQYSAVIIGNYIRSSIKYTLIGIILGAIIIALTLGAFDNKLYVGIGCIAACVLLLIGHFCIDFNLLLEKLYDEKSMYLELNDFMDLLNKENTED